MLTFKSPEDLAKLPPTDPSFPVVKDLVERLMGKKPELRFQYIQENAKFVAELDV